MRSIGTESVISVVANSLVASTLEEHKKELSKTLTTTIECIQELNL